MLLLHRQPGTTFSNIVEKGDYDPLKNAVISLDVLDELLHKWIIDVYSQDEHRGIRDIPARLWKIGVSKYPLPLPPSSGELDVLLGKLEYRTITHKGIERDLLLYNDASLAPLRNNLKKGDKVKIKYDPTDLGLIFVYDDFHGRYLSVPAIDQQYARGLTEWQHKVIQKCARQTVKDTLDPVALAEAKNYLQIRVKELVASGKTKTKTNVNLARWMSSINPAEPQIVRLKSDHDEMAAADVLTSSTDNQDSLVTGGNLELIESSVPADENISDAAESENDFENLDWSGWNGGYDLPL